MSKRARLGGRSEAWMDADDGAAGWWTRAVTSQPGGAAAVLQPIHPVLADGRGPAVGAVAVEERADR